MSSCYSEKPNHSEKPGTLVVLCWTALLWVALFPGVIPLLAERPRKLVSALTLINADTDKPIRDLVPGEVLNLAVLPTRHLNVEAKADRSVQKIVFRLNDSKRVRHETAVPFSLAGDESGDYFSWTPKEGEQAVTAIPYRNSSAAEPFTVRFTVVDRPVTKNEPIAEPKIEAAQNELPAANPVARARLNPEPAVEPAAAPSPVRKLEIIDPASDAAKTCRGFVNHENGNLTVVCSHDFTDAISAKVVQPANSVATESVVCEFLNTASPMITACASSPALLAALRRGELMVAIERESGARVALPVRVQ